MMKKQKLAIIGASYLQLPLIQSAKRRGIETHVFAWQCGDVGEKEADFFYPISTVEKEQILDECRRIGIDGICSIASDLAMITVNYVAEQMGLVGNSMACTAVSTNKHKMRKCFEAHGDPSPKSLCVRSGKELDGVPLNYPVIVKPVDRSGSRGITKLMDERGLEEAISRAMDQGFEKCALVEEFVTGEEYSVEFLSWQGEHHFLAMTRKFTTGAPGYIETAHLEPAGVDEETERRAVNIVRHALTSLGIQYGASHSELKIAEDGQIKLIEIGGRMGGDCIGSDLVRLSTGVDFVRAVIDVALGIRPVIEKQTGGAAAVRFIFSQKDVEVLNILKKTHPQWLVEENIHDITSAKVTDSSARFGYFILKAPSAEELMPYLPEMRA